MIVFRRVPRLRVSLVTITLFLLGACAHHPGEHPGNVLVRLCRGAEVQAENEAQLGTLRRALEDLRNQSIDELRSARYEAADGRPEQRTLIEVLHGHIVPEV